MPRLLLFALLIFITISTPAASRSICKRIGDGELGCDIRSTADCLAIEDYPYARNLYCPASFTAANQVFEMLLRNLGKQHHIQKQFTFYQTLPVSNPKKPGHLDPSQTQTPCMQTSTPWNANLILGVGQPLCHLIAYVSSVGSQGLPALDPQNPLPPTLRDYPQYFSALLDPSPQLPLTEFKSGGNFDPLVKGLGRDGYKLFVSDYPIYSSNTLYVPSPKALDPNYQGMSAGGGGGSGAEVVLNGNGTSRTLLTFGGGGVADSHQPGTPILQMQFQHWVPVEAEACSLPVTIEVRDKVTTSSDWVLEPAPMKDPFSTAITNPFQARSPTTTMPSSSPNISSSSRTCFNNSETV